MRREVFDMMIWWCEKGIDGFRMDVISMISKTKEMNKKVLSRYNIMTVGEAAGVTTELAEQYAGEDRGELNMVNWQQV